MKSLPKNKLSKLCLKLMLIFFILFIIVQVVSYIANKNGAFNSEEINAYKILMPVLVIPMALIGISSFFTGLISIIKHKERSFLVFIAVFIGFLILLFAMGEFLFPH